MNAGAVFAVVLYAVLLAGMLAYGLNCFFMVWWHRRIARTRPAPATPPDTIPDGDPHPFVTVQLPLYNEERVAPRLLDAVGKLRWPRDRLEIQVLDDSTDATPAAVDAAMRRLRRKGLRVEHLRRAVRTGFKAGALAEGMARARGEFFAIFDADFVPPPDFLERAVSRLVADPTAAAVQGRWTHLNRPRNALTRAQALAIDGHFGVEQAVRCATPGWFGNFNGSAGVWRREAIEAAGGWSADTLTEDLDLSYRAQLAGWHIAYDVDLVCPAELPASLDAFKAQQRRWARGSIQTARKVLPAVWRSRASLGAKVQATLHLTHYAVHALILATALLSVPCVLWPGVAAGSPHLAGVLLPFALAMSGPTALYLYAQRVLGGDVRAAVRDIGPLTLLGIGIAVSNAWAVAEALTGSSGTFERTPKTGDVTTGEWPAAVPGNLATPTAPAARGRRGPALRWLHLAEGAVALYCLGAAVALVWTGIWVVAPFMLLDALGLGVVATWGARAWRIS